MKREPAAPAAGYASRHRNPEGAAHRASNRTTILAKFDSTATMHPLPVGSLKALVSARRATLFGGTCFGRTTIGGDHMPAERSVLLALRTDGRNKATLWRAIERDFDLEEAGSAALKLVSRGW